jgi:hypothetical protein
MPHEVHKYRLTVLEEAVTHLKNVSKTFWISCAVLKMWKLSSYNMFSTLSHTQKLNILKPKIIYFQPISKK